MPISSINPANGETLATFTARTAHELEVKLALADSAFREHRRTTIESRASKMFRAGEILDTEKASIARLITHEVGKTLQSSVEEVEKCARCCHYYAEHAAQFLADAPLEYEGAHAYIRYLPLGPVVAIMPWNFPLWQVIRFAAPTLMGGNVGLLKHADNVPQCALLLEDVFRRAGFAEGIFQTLLIETDQVASVIEDPRVVAATLTGSERAGSAVASLAGKNLKKMVLELGGSDPFIVMPSADLNAAVPAAIKSRMLCNGQSCVAAKRFIVAEEVADDFTARFVEGMERLRVGDPMEAATEVGPLATPKILASLESQVQRTVAAGARILTGGSRLDGPGNFYLPTVLTDFSPSSPAMTEEFFGPVALLFCVKTLDEAISLANDSPYGLGSSVWTTDPNEQQRFINEIEAGQTFVNSMVSSDPRLPFGGLKNSGYGRELFAHGLREFMNLKTVYSKG